MATKAELTTGSASAATELTEEPQLAATEHTKGAATEHNEEPQLAELVTQESGLSSTVQVTLTESQYNDLLDNQNHRKWGS